MPDSLPALIAQRAAVNPAKTILRRKTRGIWQTVTWAEFADQIQRIASGLLGLGLARGGAALILSDTRPEIVWIDIAVQSLGAASIIVDADLQPGPLAQILQATDSRVAFVENEEQLDKLLTVRAQCPALGRIVILDMKGLREFSDPHCLSLAAMPVTDASHDWRAAAAEVSGDDRATILFPGATTTGAQGISQRELLQRIAAVSACLDLAASDERLALAGMNEPLERVWGLYAALQSGCISNYLESPETVVENLRELQPTVLGTDAAIWNHLHATTEQAVAQATLLQRLLYRWAIRAGRRGGLGGRVANLLVLAVVRRKLGMSRLRLAFTGGEAVAAPALEWARSLGLRIERIEAFGVPGARAEERFDRVMQRAPA